MEDEFKTWLTESGKSSKFSVYSESMNRLSVHYADQIGRPFDIYRIEYGQELSKLSKLYGRNGKFSNVGDENGGNIRSALKCYVKFRAHQWTIQQNRVLTAAIEDYCENDSNSDKEEYHKEVEVYFNQLNTVAPNNNQIQLDSQTMSFTYEKDLQQVLCMQVAELFPEYLIYGGAEVGIEYSVGSRRIDVLLENTSDKSLLVVELKSGLADFRVYGQISMYMGLIRREFRDRIVKGVIVAGQIDDSLIQASENNSSIKLLTYKVSLKLEEA